MQLENALLEYLLELKLGNKSDRTIKSVKNNCGLFITYVTGEFEITEIEEIGKGHIKSYILNKQSQKLSPTYINSIIKNLRMWFKYLMEEGYIKENYMLRVTWQKETKSIIQAFSVIDVSKMLKIYRNNGYYLESRNRCIIHLLFDTGIRNSELCDIKMIDVKENSILIHGKGDKQRYVPLSPLLQKEMMRYENNRITFIKQHTQKEYYFVSQKGKRLTPETVENVVKDCGKLAGVDKSIRCSPHTCRHTYAQMQLKNGLDVYSLSRLLGHENIAITKRYLQSMQDSEILELAVKTSPLMNL